jgi:hypothetical protein
MKPVVLFRGLARALEVGLLLAWFSWTGLVMSWAGHRPLRPDREHPYPYNDHGILYVSRDDLRVSHLLLGITLVMIVGVVLVHFSGRRLFPDFEGFRLVRADPKRGILDNRSDGLRHLAWLGLFLAIALISSLFLTIKF